jgi:glycosyltransferase involved in cell wall biosynthesis
MPGSALLLLDNHHPPDRRAAWVSAVTRQAGLRVRILAWDRREPGSAAAEAAPGGDEEIVRIRIPAPWGGGPSTVVAAGRFTARALADARRVLRGVDVVIASDLYLLPLGCALARRANVPLIYEAREDWAALEAERRHRALRALATRAETALARGADLVVVPGDTRAPRWRRVGRDPVVLRNIGLSEPRAATGRRWDVAACGLLAEQRRPDLFLDVAERRPDLRFVLTGAGRLERWVAARSAELDNVDFLGWVPDVDAVLAASAVIVYGQDPRTCYSAMTCPSTLYQALRLQRPLVFYCDGEPGALARRFRIGVRCAPEPEAVSSAIDVALARDDWEFVSAWESVRTGAERPFLERVSALLGSGRP